MPTFNWNLKIEAVPATWRNTLGENVKIALFDSGMDLTHPDLKHLDKAGRKFNVTKQGVDPNNPELMGKDNVEDAVPLRRAHGTHCASIIAATSIDKEGVKGVAPKAELFKMKIIDENKESYLDYFIKGMQLAIKKDVDVISISYFPFFKDPVNQAAINDVFAHATEKRIAVVTALQNTSKLDRLNELRFPASRPETIVAGVFKNKLAEKLSEKPVFVDEIDFLFPETPVKYCTLFRGNQYIERGLSSSNAVAALSGVIALLISHWKQTERAYEPRTKEALLKALDQITIPFDLQQILNNPTLQIFKA